MITKDVFEKIVTDTSKEFPDFKIAKKADSVLMKSIGFIFKYIFPICRNFMDNFITTIGTTVYVSSNWETYSYAERAEILRHERIHMRQARDYGQIWFGFLYLCVWFPVFFATYRAKFEREAYEESLRADAEYLGINSIASQKERYVYYFTGPNYGWMWISKSGVEKWFDETVEKIKNDMKQ